MDLRYTLMHHDVEVAELTFDEAYHNISKIDSVMNYEHLPLGTVQKGIVNKVDLNDWLIGRSIPASRDGLNDALEKLNIRSVKELLFRSYGLSLSDHYWIKPFGTDLTWQDVNFFDNDFSEDIGNVLFGEDAHAEFSFNSPDNTSDGWLRKRWKIADGKRVLIKGGSGKQQEPFNEVIASKIFSLLDIPHVDYTVIWQNDRPYSVCEDFVNNSTELIPAYRLTLSQKKSNSDSYYQHFLKCCNNIHIDAVPFLDRLLTVDYIIANEDRHFNNFGLIRNPKTLDYIDFAPVYDSGTSLSYDKDILSYDYKSKPFNKNPQEQLKLVSSFDWLDTSKLRGISDFIKETLYPAVYYNIMTADRPSKIASFVERRIEYVDSLSHTRNRQQEQPLRNDLIEQQQQDGYAAPAPQANNYTAEELKVDNPKQTASLPKKSQEKGGRHI